MSKWMSKRDVQRPSRRLAAQLRQVWQRITGMVTSPQSDHRGELLMFGEAWSDCLPESHGKALYAALCDLVDEFLDDLGDDENFCISELPEKYRLRYNGAFRRRCLVSLVTVGYKLALPEQLDPLPSCTAEELALHILIEQAKNQLRAEAIEPDFSLFVSLAFQDLDFEVLYDMSIDGIEDTTVGAEMAYGNLRFNEWFEPFLNATMPIHPYGAEDAAEST